MSVVALVTVVVVVALVAVVTLMAVVTLGKCKCADGPQANGLVRTVLRGLPCAIVLCKCIV